MKSRLAQLLLISAITSASCMVSGREYAEPKPTGRDAIPEDEQAEKISKAEQKRLRKMAKRVKS